MLTPITLNGRPYSLYFTASSVIKANRILRALERLARDEDERVAARLIGLADKEVIAVYLAVGLDHEQQQEQGKRHRIQGLDADKVLGWLDEPLRKRRDDFFTEIQKPLLDCLKGNGLITWTIEPVKPGDGEAAEPVGAAERPTGASEN